MYSKAPSPGLAAPAMVAVLPTALFTSTVALLLAYTRTRDAIYFRGAMIADLAGVLTALIAMIPSALEGLALLRRARARARPGRLAASALLVTSAFAASGWLLHRAWAARVMVDGRWSLDPTLPLAVAMLGLVMMVGAATAGGPIVPAPPAGALPAGDRGPPARIRPGAAAAFTVDVTLACSWPPRSAASGTGSTRCARCSPRRTRPRAATTWRRCRRATRWSAWRRARCSRT